VLPAEQWVDGWDAIGSASYDIAANTSWTTSFLLTPSQFDLPASGLTNPPQTQDVASCAGTGGCGRQQRRGSAGDLSAVGMLLDDARAALTAAYGSAVGQDVSHDFAPEVRFSPCVAHPGRCYGADGGILCAVVLGVTARMPQSRSTTSSIPTATLACALSSLQGTPSCTSRCLLLRTGSFRARRC
jgi:hypothetical protein